jgi:hypothetical protein
MTYAEHSDHYHYVTVKDDTRTALALGPFRSRREAEAEVESVRRFVHDHRFSDVYAAAFLAFGTSRVTMPRGRPAPLGKLNKPLAARLAPVLA